MSETSLNLLLLPAAAVLAPLAARAVGRWLRVPVVVFELMLGIALGPSLLGWMVPSDFLDLLSEFGLAMLFFMAGSEMEFAVLRGRSGRRAIGGWFLSAALGLAVGLLVAPGEPAVFIGIALCSTALGTLLPILRDAGDLPTPFGKAAFAVGAAGEFGPLVAISLFLGSRDPGVATIVLAVFVVVVALAAWWALRVPQGALHRVVGATLHTSGQFAVRVVLLILMALVALSIVLDLDMLLGAFAAGIVWKLLMRDAAPADRDQVESKVEAVAFGFLVPVFFIYTGVTFDLASLLATPVLFLVLPLVLVALLVVRGLPAMLAAPAGARGRDRIALGFFGATGLPIIVAVTSIGVSDGVLAPQAASLLVGGGMLSVLLFPLVGTLVRRQAPRRVAEPIEDDAA